MAARVIHVGADTCHRLPVLESAGYVVDVCSSLPRLLAALETEIELDAVLISEDGGCEHQEAAMLARSHSSAPVVLFRETQRSLPKSTFDLVVPVLDPPEEWLTDIAGLIHRTRANVAKSKEICANSQALRQDAAGLRARSRRERTRSLQECPRNVEPAPKLVLEPKTGS